MSKDDKKFGLGSGGSTFNDDGGKEVDRSELPYPNGKPTGLVNIADIKRMAELNYKNK
jgi:hypothetical protein